MKKNISVQFMLMYEQEVKLINEKKSISLENLLDLDLI